ncbi:arylsulfotransferase family protein [uncultured Draconibacterium sp.]|uniref:arylsulfotransferase family protein n=1 Tax=uncultured Draconibacterium sp. TaxID=1573823 RepID=UPI0032170CD6
MKCRSIGIIVLVALGVVCSSLKAFAQQNSIVSFFPTIEHLESNGAAEGYYFMGSKGLTATGASHYIAIIDNYGTPVFFRKMKKATSSVCLLPDGRIAYLNGVPRKLFILNDWLTPVETLSIEEVKPNGHDWDVDIKGNVVLMGEISSVKDMSQLIEGGNVQAEILDLVVQEFDRDFNLLHNWSSADHFDLFDGNDNSPYLDYTEEQLDYVHANAISIDTDTSYLISCRHMDEITKIDRRTGELIWRLGGKNNQFEFVNDELGFSHQHSVRALPNGHILLFDNGNLHAEKISSAVEYEIDEMDKTATLVKRFYRNPTVYSNHQGTTQRIHNGNTIINWGPYWPSLTEFNPDGSPALEWDFTKHSFCPRIEKYIWETKVFSSSSDSITFGTWESDTLTQSLWFKNNSPDSIQITTVESRTENFGINTMLPVLLVSGDSVKLDFWFDPGNSETGYFDDVLTIACDTEEQRIARQVKVNGRKSDNISPVAQLVSGQSNVALNEKIRIQLSEKIQLINGGELNYESIDAFVEVRKNNIAGELIPCNAVISADKTLVTIVPDEELKIGTVYFVQLKSGLSDFAGNELSAFTAQFSTTITSAGSNKNNAGLEVYPNPVKDRLMVTVSNESDGFTYQIINGNGAVVINDSVYGAMRSAEIDLSKLPGGIYLFIAHTTNNSYAKKIVKY